MDMNHIFTIAGIVFASTGFWQFIQSWWDKKYSKKTNEEKLLMGLAYKTIIDLCQHYLARGEIDADEYKELNQYLFQPYKAKGGNGTAARLMEEVEKLPIKKEVK